MLGILAGIAGKQARQVAPHRHAAQVPRAPERPGIAHQDLDHRAAFPNPQGLRQSCRQSRGEGELRGCRRRQCDQDLARFYGAADRADAHTSRCMLDSRGWLAQPHMPAELTRQIVGKRLHGFAQRVLQLRHLVGYAAVIVDQMPQWHLIQRQAPQALDHRAEGSLRLPRIPLALEPCSDG